jgi:hypothetical protein
MDHQQPKCVYIHVTHSKKSSDLVYICGVDAYQTLDAVVNALGLTLKDFQITPQNRDQDSWDFYDGGSSIVKLKLIA